MSAEAEAKAMTETSAPYETEQDTRALVESLVLIRARRDQRKAVNDDLEALEGPVKAWLEAHPGETLADLERGITAEIEETNKPVEWDIKSMAEQHPQRVIEAALMGLLSGRTSAIRSQRGKAACADMLLDRYCMPTGVKQSLRVERQR